MLKESETIILPVHYSGKVFNSNQKPFLKTYLLETSVPLPLVLICPGGGYEHLSERESEPVARKMNSLGFHAAVLSYSLAPMEFPAALCDLAEAVATIRGRAAEWNVNPDGIVVAGFSAGGHLAASLGCYWGFGLLDDLVPHSKDEIRPNYMLLCYPVITADVKHCHEGSIRNVLGKNNLDMRDFVSIENHVEPSFPPTFMWHTLEDEAVPAENSLLLAMALRREGVDFEYHLFQKGCHGLSLATPETAKPDGSCQQKECAVWPELFKAWLDSRVTRPESGRGQ